MTRKSINYIKTHLNNIIDDKLKIIIHNIEKDYNRNIQISNYVNNNNNNSINNLLNDILRCKALVKSGIQCKRSKKDNGCDFCKIHQKTQKFGLTKYEYI